MPSQQQLAQIHIAKKDLALTDDAYRDILRNQFSVKSSKELTERRADALIELFKDKGWKPKPATKPRKNKNFIEIPAGPAAKQQRKVLAMWKELATLHESGYEMDKLHTRVKKQFNVDRFEWLVDPESLHILITDLAKRIDSAKKQPKRA